MEVQKTCCVTGHRKIPRERLGKVRCLLTNEIQKANMAGYGSLIMGGAEGVDLTFGELILAFQDSGHQFELIFNFNHGYCRF